MSDAIFKATMARKYLQRAIPTATSPLRPISGTPMVRAGVSAPAPRMGATRGGLQP